MERIIAIDLFCGAGGTTSGLKKSGIKVNAAVEIDIAAAKTYHHNNKEVNLFIQDIKDIDGNDLLHNTNKSKNDRLLLVACPPCQGFSTLGSNNENDERNLMIFQYLRLINEIKPDFLLMENVAGILHAKNSYIFNKFIKEVKKSYIVNYSILNAADYGVPQTRKRFVLHGIRKDLINSEFQLELPSSSHSINGKDGKLKWVPAAVIMDLPAIKAGEYYDSADLYNHFSNNLSELNLQRIRHIRKNGGSRSSLPEELQLECHRKSKGHGDVYGIIDINKPAKTITGGCMTFSKGRFGHPTQDRALSAREAARLQSFDDNYIFLGNRGQIAKQIGNAVPVKLAEASGKYFMSILNKL